MADAGGNHRERGRVRIFATGALALVVFFVAWQARSVDIPCVEDDWIPLLGEEGSGADCGPIGETRVCTLIGCVGGVTVAVVEISKPYPTAARLRACDDLGCGTRPLDKQQGGSALVILGERDSAGTVPVRIAILDRAGKPLHRVTTEVQTSHEYPNGQACDDGCVNGHLRYNALSASLIDTGKR